MNYYHKSIFVLFILFFSQTLTNVSVENCRDILKQNNLFMHGGQFLLLEYLIRTKNYTNDHKNSCLCLIKANQKIDDLDNDCLAWDLIIDKIIMVLNSTKFYDLNMTVLVDIAKEINTYREKYKIFNETRLSCCLTEISRFLKYYLFLHKTEANKDDIDKDKEYNIGGLISDHEHHYIYFTIDIENKIKKVSQQYEEYRKKNQNSN